MKVTLVEVALLLVAVPLAVPTVTPRSQAALETRRVSRDADAWRAHHGVCPSPVAVSARNDPWGHPLAIHCEPGRVQATSAGEDGRFGTSDDLTATTISDGAPTIRHGPATRGDNVSSETASRVDTPGRRGV